MDRINEIAADRYQLSQKDDNVRLIIQNISNLSDAYDFLLELSEYNDALATA
jgi:hypothetical protein